MSAHILSVDYALSLDAADPLAAFRDQFVFAEPHLIYLDGNSLGRLPKATVTQQRQAVETAWGERLIRGWGDGWITLSTRIGDKIADLVGASAGEVVVADSTSVNLYKLALAAIRARPGRAKIVTDDLNFPSDLYIFQGICELTGTHLEIIPSPDGIHGPVEALTAAIDENTALVSLSHTVFKSAYTYDMAAINQHAHAVGALTLWDLSHAAGSVQVDLNNSNADLAVGCTYKYLNGGPGAPAFLYVRHDLQDQLANPVQGWMGAANLFDFDLSYAPAAGIKRFLTGTPPILSTAAIEAGVDLLREAGMASLRAKSVAQTAYLIQLWEAVLKPLGFTLNSPTEPAQRGSHISLGHPDAWRIDQAMIHDVGVLPDFRAPDNIRLGIAPIYTSFAEIHEAVMRIKRVMDERLYERYSLEKAAVT